MIDEVKKKLQAEVEALSYELQHTLPAALKKAVELGDLKENSDYHAALERQQFVGARLNQLKNRLSQLSNIDFTKIPRDCVGLGSRVVVEDMDSGEEETYEIVIPDAMDIDLGHISVASPLGRALVDTKEGDEVEVRLPTRTRELKVKSLTTIHDMAQGK